MSLPAGSDGGTILDTHGSPDPEVALIARTITCPEGRVRMDITPEVSQGMPQDLTQRDRG